MLKDSFEVLVTYASLLSGAELDEKIDVTRMAAGYLRGYRQQTIHH